MDIYVSNDRRHRSRHVRACYGSEVENIVAADIGSEAYHDVNGTPVHAHFTLEELKSYGRWAMSDKSMLKATRTKPCVRV